MKALVYVYEDSKKQTVHFRGYVKSYNDRNAVITTCPEVRTNRAAAEKDAKKLMKSLKS